jgi:hypothetical protein
MLLAFATWTLLLLIATIGVYRWSHILTGRAPIGSFRADQVEGAAWYVRATRAHANCLENLAIFGAIVFALHVGSVTGSLVDALAVVVVAARVLQSLTHVVFVQTNPVVSIRFTFFSVQVACFLWLIGIVVVTHIMSA